MKTQCFSDLPKVTKLRGLPIPNSVFCHHTNAASFEPGMEPLTLSPLAWRQGRQRGAWNSQCPGVDPFLHVPLLLWTVTDHVLWRPSTVGKHTDSGATLPGLNTMLTPTTHVTSDLSGPQFPHLQNGMITVPPPRVCLGE